MNNMMGMLMQLRNNPMSILSQFGVPQDIANDPQAVIQHLMNNGKITQAQYDQAVQMANSLKGMMQ